MPISHIILRKIIGFADERQVLLTKCFPNRGVAGHCYGPMGDVEAASLPELSKPSCPSVSYT